MLMLIDQYGHGKNRFVANRDMDTGPREPEERKRLARRMDILSLRLNYEVPSKTPLRPIFANGTSQKLGSRSIWVSIRSISLSSGRSTNRHEAIYTMMRTSELFKTLHSLSTVYLKIRELLYSRWIQERSGITMSCAAVLRTHWQEAA